jgi:deazaflavin-dependent oxidoreductase (nitroreductase family)
MPLSSVVRRLGHRLWFARVGRTVLVPSDRLVARLTKGRVVALGLVPCFLITTTGRRSGLPRRQPLLYARDGDGFVVMGSNWGQHHHPAWSANLLAHPEATVTVGGQDIPVRATLVTGAERARLRGLLVELWPAYATYERRAGRRHLRLFRLDPVGRPAGPAGREARR